MGVEARLAGKGLKLPGKGEQAKGYLNLAVQVGDLIFTSGHVSDLKGKLGADLNVEQGKKAAHEAIVKVLGSVRSLIGTLDNLRVVRLLGCVNSTLEFTDQHLVVNGASDLIHELFGKDDLGFHARSALGYVQLPTGAAVEIEAIFAIEHK